MIFKTILFFLFACASMVSEVSAETTSVQLDDVTLKKGYTFSSGRVTVGVPSNAFAQEVSIHVRSLTAAELAKEQFEVPQTLVLAS